MVISDLKLDFLCTFVTNRFNQVLKKCSQFCLLSVDLCTLVAPDWPVVSATGSIQLIRVSITEFPVPGSFSSSFLVLMYELHPECSSCGSGCSRFNR
jgi:hypothetical protein